MKSPVIRAVIFDLYETLVTERGTEQPRAGRLAPALGLDEPAFRSLWRARRPLVTRGVLSFGEAIKEIGRRLGTVLDEDLVQRVVDARIAAKTKVFERIDPDVAAMVGRLRAQGIFLGVVSNGFAEDVAPWSTCELARHFACAAFSCQTGTAKPEPAIYRGALSALGVPADAAIYVGDGADNELAGALSVGLRIAAARWFVRDVGEVPAGAVALDSCDDVFSTLEWT
jgi:putative hydrolase of the HAD superfamily